MWAVICALHCGQGASGAAFQNVSSWGTVNSQWEARVRWYHYLGIFFFLSQHGICLLASLWSQQEHFQKKFLIFSKPVCRSWFRAALSGEWKPRAKCVLVWRIHPPLSSIPCADCAPRWHVQSLQPLFAFFFCLQEPRAQCSLNL